MSLHHGCISTSTWHASIDFSEDFQRRVLNKYQDRWFVHHAVFRLSPRPLPGLPISLHNMRNLLGDNPSLTVYGSAQSTAHAGLRTGTPKAAAGPLKRKIGSPYRSPPIFRLPGTLCPGLKRLCFGCHQAAMAAAGSQKEQPYAKESRHDDNKNTQTDRDSAH